MPDDEHPGDGEERNHPATDREPGEGVRIAGEGAEPPLRLSDDTGPLPHWTDPPTGEVPRIFLDESSSDDIGSWSGLSNQQPVWRDEKEGHAEHADPAAHDEGAARPRPTTGKAAEDAESSAEAARVTSIRTTRVGERATPRGRTTMTPAGLGTDLPMRVAVG